MFETLWFLLRCIGLALVGAVLLLIVSCSARADTLDDLGFLCLQGNVGACQIFQAMINQQNAQIQMYQQGFNSTTNYLTQQQYLANQRMQRIPNSPVICTQQGVFTVCR